ncbi:MAG: hypothetical protein IMW89_16895 [Ktedonobacteraceae bacterium]|nr:hypothetical protein [Ktedonobacteraceae bacterium]
MTKHDLMTVEQILTEMQKVQEAMQKLQTTYNTYLQTLITRARMQEYTENQYNTLLQIAKAGTEMVLKLKEGDIVSAEWEARSHELARQATKLVQESE